MRVLIAHNRYRFTGGEERYVDLLENHGTEDVATKATIKGPLENPNASTWEIVSRLVQNAFFKAILPGLEDKTLK